MQNVRLDYHSLGLTIDNILHEMRYGTMQPEKEVMASIEALLTEVSLLTIPMYSYQLLSGKINDTSILFDNGGRLEVGPIISSLLQGASYFALFVATVGSEFQDYQESIQKENDILKSFIVDVIGTCTVEKAGDMIEKSLKEQIGDYKHTNRFSPGYCGWHLSYQQPLFNLLGGTPCGIELSDVFLMKPIKSISGVIGIGSHVNEKKYGCQYCELETCYKRKDKII